MVCGLPQTLEIYGHYVFKCFLSSSSPGILVTADPWNMWIWTAWVHLSVDLFQYMHTTVHDPQLANLWIQNWECGGPEVKFYANFQLHGGSAPLTLLFKDQLYLCMSLLFPYTPERLCLFFFLNFSLGNSYSLVLRFIHSFLDCVESTEDQIKDSLYLSSSVFDFQNFNSLLFLVSISAEITHLILHFAYIFH